MKKLFAIPLAGLMLLGACSKDKEGATPAPEAPGIVFELSAVDRLETGKTKAPLYSQEAVQSVEVVNVYVFQKQTGGTDYLYLKTYPITGWVKGSTFNRFEIGNTEMLPAGDYQFLAVGTDHAGVNPYTMTTPVVGTTKFQDFAASIAAANNQELELFAGSKAASVAGTGLRESIQMSRQVAGVLGYFKNVPVEEGGQTVRYLRLAVSNANKQVNLTTGIGTDPVGASYNIINVDLSTQAKSADGTIYTGNDLTTAGVVKLDNTQLNGAFLIPVNGVTLTLGLYAADGTALKTWNVAENSNLSFNIMPNHFYSLGVKTQAGNTDGGGGTGAIPDAPIDLMKDQAISVTISPDWSAIHNLGLEDMI